MSVNNELSILNEVVQKLEQHFEHSFTTSTNLDEVATVLHEVADKMKNNYPYFDEKYAGQMLKPPHPIARLAYSLALYINPNNHALDGGRASSAMEKEAVNSIAQMFGWSQYLGHLTGGGTMANMEALWVSRKIHENKYVVASEMAHYTHERISEVLQLPFKKISCDSQGRMDVESLESQLKRGEIGTIVVTLGTTGTGAIDPMSEILSLQKKYDFRIHIDAAYGGYFKLAQNLSDYARKQYDLIYEADSLVIDPHKHGLQPYGCGCIIFKDPAVGQYYKHDSPYTYFSSAELHLGEISLECSRAGAAAVALWATHQMFPLEPAGIFGKGIENCRKAALVMADYVKNDEHYLLLHEPEIDIVVWAPFAKTASAISALSEQIFTKAAERGVHLALLKYPVKLLPYEWQKIEYDQEYITCLRNCFMKHNHEEWVENIWDIIKSINLNK